MVVWMHYLWRDLESWNSTSDGSTSSCPACIRIHLVCNAFSISETYYHR